MKSARHDSAKRKSTETYMQTPDPTHNAGQALRQAAAAGDTATLQQLLDAGASVDPLDNAALRWAVRHRQAEAVRVLLEAGAPLEPYAEEFLTLTARNGDAPTLELLLASLPGPRDPELLNRLFLLAVESQNIPATVNLLRLGADPSAKDNQALMLAACGGDMPMLRLLRKHDVDFRARNSQALFNAVFAPSPEAANYLLQEGVDPQVQRGIPLQLAIMGGEAEIAEILLDAGVPLTVPEWLVDCACKDSLETLQLLLQRGSNLGDFADALVGKAVEHAAPRVLFYVLQHAKVSQQILDDGLEPAVRADAGPVVRLLLHAGANPKANAGAAFRVAIESGVLGLARWLLQAGASIADLAPRAVTDVLAVGDQPFLIELLRKGLSVEGAPFVPLLATLFCQAVTPADLLRDSSGKLHPEPLFSTRLRFAAAVASQAGEAPQTKAVLPTNWLSEVMAEIGPRPRLNKHR